MIVSPVGRATLDATSDPCISCSIENAGRDAGHNFLEVIERE